MSILSIAEMNEAIQTLSEREPAEQPFLIHTLSGTVVLADVLETVADLKKRFDRLISVLHAEPALRVDYRKEFLR